MYMSENGQAKFYTLVLTTLETDCSFVEKKLEDMLLIRYILKGLFMTFCVNFTPMRLQENKVVYPESQATEGQMS